jgi:hypothetical protein
MNEENIKIAKIKKSCHIGKIVSNIMCIITIVGCVCSAVAGIAIFASRAETEPQLAALVEEGKFDEGKFNSVYIDLGSPEEWHSDIPALQNIIDEYPHSFSISTSVLFMAGALVLAAVMTKLISKAFETIEKEETPFSDKVIKKVLIVMIFASVILFMTSGMALGVLGGLTTWVVYSVLDYGKTLQVQSDETL